MTGPLDFPFILPKRPGTDINPAIDIEDLAGDPAGLIAGQVEGSVGDILGPAGASQAGHGLDGAVGQWSAHRVQTWNELDEYVDDYPRFYTVTISGWSG